MEPIKSVDDMSLAEAAAMNAQLAAVRAQVLSDQAAGAKRDDEALKVEQDWYRRNGGKK